MSIPAAIRISHISTHRPALRVLETLKLRQTPRKGVENGGLGPVLLGGFGDCSSSRTRSRIQVQYAGPECRKKFAKPCIATSSSSYLRELATAGKISGSLFAVDRRLGTFFKRLHVPNHALASVVSELKILGQFECIGRTGIFA
jgi:hypothetical protein